jgi:hypothetical protein
MAFFVFLQSYLQGHESLVTMIILGVDLSAAFLAFVLSLLLFKAAMTHRSLGAAQIATPQISRVEFPCR